MSEYKHWCGNCQIRVYYQQYYGKRLSWEDCPYTCEYAEGMRRIAQKMEEVRTYSTNTEINPESYKPAFTLINPDAKEDYLLDGRYVVKAPKRGKWVYIKNIGYFCSACMESGLSPTNADDNCGYSSDGTMNYCWNCGSKMDEVTE